MLRWPALLTVAVGPQNSPILAYTKEIQEALVETRQPFRLKILVTTGSVESSNLLDSRKSNIAIVRSDDETSKTARSIVVLQKKTLFVIARKQKPSKPVAPVVVASKTVTAQTPSTQAPSTQAPSTQASALPAAVTVSPGTATNPKPSKDKADTNKKASADLLPMFGKLKGGLLKRLGTDDLPIIREALEHYGIKSTASSLKTYNRKEAEAAFKDNKLDFLIILAHPSETAIRELVRTVRTKLGDDFLLVAPPGAKGLAYQLKHLELSALPAGVFGGNPPLPKEDLQSVAVSYEIVATNKISERKGALLTKTLTDLRTQLRGSDDGEFNIELPSDEEPRRYLPHAGTVAQINSENKTFLDAYSDIIWLTLFGLGLAGSAITSLLTWLGLGHKPRKVET